MLLSAYAAQSHVYWQRSLQQMFAHWQWRVLSLPPRHFSWRVRGNPLYWAMVEREALEQDCDLLIATSMVDLATLRGLVPSLASVPTVVYFHENQFAYPQNHRQQSLLEAQMVSLYSSLAADNVLFNSAYNRDSFHAGCAALLAKLPDRVPPGIVTRLADKSMVLPVPLDIREDEPTADWPGKSGVFPARPLRLLWTGRFEYDKGGERLLQILLHLERDGLDYELAVTGQQFRNSPEVFRQIQSQLSHRLVQFGYMQSTEDYRALQGGADVVLATALHEFQGLAVLEAVANRCLPVVPNRLVYPEIYPPHYCYESNLADPEQEARSAARLIHELAASLRHGAMPAPDVTAFAAEQLAPRYERVFLGLAGTQDSQ